MQFLQITSDRDAFGDHRAVVQLEYRGFTQRIEPQELRSPGGTRRDVELDAGRVDTLFGQEAANPKSFKTSIS